MSIAPTGHIAPDGAGHGIVIERAIRAPIGDVWRSIVDPERMNRWIGTWSGEAGAGKRVLFTMTAEGSAEPEEVLIQRCEAPRLLEVESHVGDQVWNMRVALSEADGVTILVFRQVVDLTEDSSSIGVGWEYYLDRLVAVHDGTPFASWDDYYPSQLAHWQDEARRAAANASGVG
jgi:uncharacterized protein YndB with AHSA1/START domain